MARKGYDGWTPAPVVKGRCTVHGDEVGKFSGLCYRCHVDALEAAGVGAVPPLPLPTGPAERQGAPPTSIASARELRRKMGWT